MSDIQTRPFSRNYSGLINQSVIALAIALICVTSQELMKRRRRKGYQISPEEQGGLGSRESWQFGYLYQGRCWARFPSPPSPRGWPLSWVKQIWSFPEEKMLELRGIDATLYIRFLRGAVCFALIHTFTTFFILFPIHVEFSEVDISTKSMTRASIASLVLTSKGLSLLWIHVCLLFWITFTWIGTLIWICNGAFRLRKLTLAAAEKLCAKSNDLDNVDKRYYPHPHPPYGFADILPKDIDDANKGLHLRTVMVSNIPPNLRSEKDLKEYFEYYMSRKVEKPSVGLASSTQPGFFNKSFAFLFNRAKRLPGRIPVPPLIFRSERASNSQNGLDDTNGATNKQDPEVPAIERVVVARHMTELSSLLERREEVLRLLETAHIKLATKALRAVEIAIERRSANKTDKPLTRASSRAAHIAKKKRLQAPNVPDLELGEPQDGSMDEEKRMNMLIKALKPYVHDPKSRSITKSIPKTRSSGLSKYTFRRFRMEGSEDSDAGSPAVIENSQELPPSEEDAPRTNTVWEALLALPRSSLDAYQPLVNLSHFYRGKIVPSIDYYTAKLNLLTSLVTENRAKAVHEYSPVSTAFVTFADPIDARRACKYLAVHPKNPLACLVTMAPAYQDLDWIRVMKTSYSAEFVKDWVVDAGVWAFTIFWLFPVSLLVGLVSIQNISAFWPSLKAYLDKHAWESELLQSFIPTLLVALLALLIPLILLLIAKKAHTITTLSSLHDRIMTRYYKFLIVNVLVFFCVGTAALQSILQSFKSSASTRPDILKIVADSFPTAGPFYVGWLIFTTAMHGCFELALFGLPLILYPSTSRQATPRKRTVGVRPRTLNYYYWLPNHLLVIHILLLFGLLNPLVLPFGAFYLFIQSGVIKNQLIHVYAKNYEGNGKLLLVRMVRYSLDGLILAQAVFLAYMAVLSKKTNVGLSVVLIVFTAIVKLLMTRMCRLQFEKDDITEAEILCGLPRSHPEPDPEVDADENPITEIVEYGKESTKSSRRFNFSTWRLPDWVEFSYTSLQHGTYLPKRRLPNPFGPNGDHSFSKLNSISHDERHDQKLSEPRDGPSINVTSTADNGYPWGKNRVAEKAKAEVGINNGDPISAYISGPVVTHPPPIPWDDQSSIDLPYDNPFYTRTIDNVLWLPRDPLGILDLDDTVDLKISLTVDSTAGNLGTWYGLQHSESPEQMMGLSPAGHERTTANAVKSDIDGTEEIDLPPSILSRVKSGENGVEQAARPRRPSNYSTTRSKLGIGRKSSGSTLSGQPRRPSVLDTPPITSYRSFSEGAPGRARSSSFLSALNTSNIRSDAPPPDAHAQAQFVAANASASQISLAAPKLSRQQNISTRDAIAREVVAEEILAFNDRIDEEKAEREARSTKSWLTSWMFKKTE